MKFTTQQLWTMLEDKATKQGNCLDSDLWVKLKNGVVQLTYQNVEGNGKTFEEALESLVTNLDYAEDQEAMYLNEQSYLFS